MVKKFFFSFIVVALMTACNNEKSNEDHSGHGTGKEAPENAADSLYDDVMAGHDAVMPKMGKIRGAQKQAQQLLDSIAKLPAKAQAAAAGLKIKLESLVNDLNYADFAMDKWMVEFNMDSAKDNLEQRVKYLAEEKLKVTKVKEAVLGGLAKADSLLKAKVIE